MQGRTSLQCSENWLRFLDFFQNRWGLLIDKRNKTNQQVSYKHKYLLVVTG